MFSTQVIFIAIALVSSVSTRDEIVGQKFYKTEMGLTQVPSNIPSAMGEVHLNDNSIRSVHQDAFSSLSSCTLLDLGDNSISSIDSGAFNGLVNLDSLTLIRNRIRVLEQGMFDGMPLLRALNLADNVITNIQSGCFRNLGNLEELYLTSNDLTTINGDMWLGLHSLHHFHLQFNSRLQTIPPAGISNLPRLHILHLHNNAIKTLDMNIFNAVDYPNSDGHPPSLRLTIGRNPLLCDKKLCWLKRAEEEGWLSFDSGYSPDCAYNVVWDNAELNCSTEAQEVSQSTCKSYCEQQRGVVAKAGDEKDGNGTLTLALVAVGCFIFGIVIAICVILLYIRRYGAKLCGKEPASQEKVTTPEPGYEELANGRDPGKVTPYQHLYTNKSNSNSS